MKILYISDKWDDKWRRRQQFAIRLSQIPEVDKLYYVELPLSIISLVKYFMGRADNDAIIRWRRVLKSGFSFEYEKVVVITPFTVLPFFTNNAFNKININIVKYSITRNTGKFNDSIMLWATLPFAALFFNDNTKIVYDCTENFTDLWPQLKLNIINWENILFNKSKAIIVQTKSMFDRIKEKNPNIFIVENGCDLELFGKEYVAPPIMKNIKHPIIGYTGGINNRIDFELVEAVAALRPDWNFVFIGPLPEKLPINMKNVYFFSAVPYKEMVGFIKYFDICFMPHRKEGVSQSQSPIKLFDYLASGKPIISTTISGIDNYTDVVEVDDEPTGIINKIKLALKNNNKCKQYTRRKRAKNCSWDKRFDEMIKLIKGKGII